MKNLAKRNWVEVVIDIIKYIFIIYAVIFVPSIIFDIKVGITVTFVIISLWVFYEASERYHKKREEYLKDLLLNSGWNEEVINHGLEKIEKDLLDR